MPRMIRDKIVAAGFLLYMLGISIFVIWFLLSLSKP